MPQMAYYCNREAAYAGCADGFFLPGYDFETEERKWSRITDDFSALCGAKSASFEFLK
jgi:hypothetical protein